MKIKNKARTMFFILVIIGIVVAMKITEEGGVALAGGSAVLSVFTDDDWRHLIKY